MSDEPRLEEQALSKVAKTTLENQVEASSVDVDIHTDITELIQGQVDSVSVSGKDIVTPQDLHVQEVELHTERIAINLFDAFFGNIKLNQPVDATGRITVTEADINQNLQSDFIQSQLVPLKLTVDGRIVSLEFQPPMELHLPEEGKMVFTSNIQVTDKGNQQVRFTGVLYPRTPEHDILMEGFSLEQGQAVALDILVAFMEKLKELVNLPQIEFNGTAFRIQEMEVHKGSLVLQVEACIRQFPLL